MIRGRDFFFSGEDMKDYIRRPLCSHCQCFCFALFIICFVFCTVICFLVVNKKINAFFRTIVLMFIFLFCLTRVTGSLRVFLMNMSYASISVISCGAVQMELFILPNVQCIFKCVSRK